MTTSSGRGAEASLNLPISGFYAHTSDHQRSSRPVMGRATTETIYFDVGLSFLHHRYAANIYTYYY